MAVGVVAMEGITRGDRISLKISVYINSISDYRAVRVVPPFFCACTAMGEAWIMHRKAGMAVPPVQYS